MHEIQALIGSDAATAPLTAAWSAAVRRELTPGLFIVPITAALARQMVSAEVSWPDLEDVEEPAELAGRLEWLVRAIREVPLARNLAVVLTQYFGGIGEQAALLIRGDGTDTEPRAGAESINTVLASLGVVRDSESGRDEFDVVGLGRVPRRSRMLVNSRCGGAS
jgi:hypothetical protein